jgi:site-specific DNA-methyltransferase (adenine-specific)
MRLMRAAELPSQITLVEDLLIEADADSVLSRLPAGAFELIYIDPPFNTGQTQRARRLAVERDDESGDRTGFGGRRYRSTARGELAYADSFDDYAGFLTPKLERARELLAPEGTLYVHLDYREAHYVKVVLGRRARLLPQRDHLGL